MINNEQFLDKTNFNNIYLRQVIVGFLGFLKNRFTWTNTSEELGDIKIVLPIHHSLTGDNRYILDAFLDDVPDKRIETNTDQIPRGILTLKSWSIKPDEFCNPNIWLNVNKDIDGELTQIAAQTKAVPIKLTFTLDTLLDNQIDVFKLWQIYMDNMWMYRYFTFDYSNIPINAVFNFISDTENPIVRDFKYGDLEILKSQYSFDIHTFYPIFDNTTSINANKTVEWILQLWQNPNSQIS